MVPSLPRMNPSATSFTLGSSHIRSTRASWEDGTSGLTIDPKGLSSWVVPWDGQTTMQGVQLASQPTGAGDVHHGRHDTGAPATEGRGWGGSREGHLPAHAPSWEPGTQRPRP